MDQWPLIPRGPPGSIELVCQHYSAGVQLWIDAELCWLGSKEQHTRTVELMCSVGFCNSGGNGCFSILAS